MAIMAIYVCWTEVNKHLSPRSNISARQVNTNGVYGQTVTRIAVYIIQANGTAKGIVLYRM